MWDFEAKASGKPVHGAGRRAGAAPARDGVHDLARHSGDDGRGGAEAAARKLLKVKLGGEGDTERVRAVRAAAPNAELIVDANEAWTADNLAQNLAACTGVGVTLVEQPLPANDDAALASDRTADPGVCGRERA